MIQDFVNALALTNEKFWFYLDRETMTIVKNRSTVDGMDVTYLAHAFPERFLPLPNKKQIHTYAIMEEYALNAGAPASQRLHMALQGAGPFKRFRDEAHRLGLEEDWLKYRDRRFEQMAQEWCAEHHVKLSVNSDESTHTGDTQTRAATRETPPAHTPGQIVADTAASIPETDGTAVALIESIRILFHLLDDAGFEAALDDLVKQIRLKRTNCPPA